MAITATTPQHALKQDILAVRWPDGSLLTGVTSHVAQMIADDLAAKGWTRPDL